VCLCVCVCVCLLRRTRSVHDAARPASGCVCARVYVCFCVSEFVCVCVCLSVCVFCEGLEGVHDATRPASWFVRHDLFIRAAFTRMNK